MAMKLQLPTYPKERVRIVEAGGNGWLVQVWPMSFGSLADAKDRPWPSWTWNSTREGAEHDLAVLTGKRRSPIHSAGIGE
jgi:hypothetical protein